MYFGRGINDLGYAVIHKKELPRIDGKRKRTTVSTCPYFKRWLDMLTRCYRTNRPKTYYDVEVCEDWWKASNFKAWMEKQDWECKELDKDLLGDGKLYSPETCCFLPKKINIFMKCGGNKTIYPVGVTLHKGRYVSRISAGNSFAKSLGSFGCPTAARVAYLAAKKNYATSIAPLITDDNLRKVFEERFCVVRDKG